MRFSVSKKFPDVINTIGTRAQFGLFKVIKLVLNTGLNRPCCNCPYRSAQKTHKNSSEELVDCWRRNLKIRLGECNSMREISTENISIVHKRAGESLNFINHEAEEEETF